MKKINIILIESKKKDFALYCKKTLEKSNSKIQVYLSNSSDAAIDAIYAINPNIIIVGNCEGQELGIVGICHVKYPQAKIIACPNGQTDSLKEKLKKFGAILDYCLNQVLIDNIILSCS